MNDELVRNLLVAIEDARRKALAVPEECRSWQVVRTTDDDGTSYALDAGRDFVIADAGGDEDSSLHLEEAEHIALNDPLRVLGISDALYQVVGRYISARSRVATTQEPEVRECFEERLGAYSTVIMLLAEGFGLVRELDLNA
jgi:hypothetical protein